MVLNMLRESNERAEHVLNKEKCILTIYYSNFSINMDIVISNHLSASMKL